MFYCFIMFFRNFINIGISSPINFYSLPFRRIINKAEKLVKIFKESNQQIYEYAEIVLITAYEIIKEKLLNPKQS